MKFIGLLRFLRFIPAVCLVWATVWFLVPLVGGVRVSAPTTGALFAVAFVVFELIVCKALLLVINAGYRLICTKTGIKPAPSDQSSALNLRGLPYPVSLLVFFSRRVLTGTMFVVIAPALAPSMIPALPNSLSALLSGILIAAAFWLAPLAMTLMLTVPLLVVGLPAFLAVLVVSKLPRYKKMQSGDQLSEGEKNIFQDFGKLCAVLLSLPAFSLIFLQDMLPTNPKSIPPEEVPEGLTADKYYELGTQYKDMGWIFQSKMALAKAIQLGAGTEVGIKAQRYLDTKLPRNSVPAEATQRNVLGFNQMFSGDKAAAKKTFEDLIAEFPDFEWPYSNLSSIYIEEKNVEQAKSLINKALEINPSYLNAWLHLADAYELEKDHAGAMQALERACELDPDDRGVKIKKMALENR